MDHADALRADGQLHLGAVLAHLALAPDLTDGHVCASIPLGLDGGGVPQVQDRVSRVLAGDFHLFPLGFEHAPNSVECAFWAGFGEGGERGVVEAHGIALLLGLLLVFLDQLELVLLPRQHNGRVEESEAAKSTLVILLRLNSTTKQVLVIYRLALSHFQSCRALHRPVSGGVSRRMLGSQHR